MAYPQSAQPLKPKVGAGVVGGGVGPSGPVKLGAVPNLPQLPSLPPTGPGNAATFKMPSAMAPKGSVKVPLGNGNGVGGPGGPPKTNLVAAPKKTMFRAERATSVATGSSSGLEPPPRSSSLGEANIPPPLMAAMGEKAAPKSAFVPTMPLPLPPTSSLPPPLALPKPLNVPEDESSEDSGSGNALNPTTGKKSARRKASTVSPRSESARGPKRTKSSAGLEASPLHASWDAVYTDFERNLQQNAASLYPADDVALTTEAPACPHLPKSVKLALGPNSLSTHGTPFYVQETLRFYSEPTKSLTYKSTTYGEDFPFKELAMASSTVAPGSDTPSEGSGTSSEDSIATLRERSSSRNFGHIASSSLSGIGTDKKSKSPQPLLLARSSAIASSGGTLGSSSRSARSGSVAAPLSSLFAPAPSAGTTATAPPTTVSAPPPSNAPSFPYSPRGSLNMLGSWINTDHNARLEERKRRNNRAVGAPQHVFQALDASSAISDPTEPTFPAVSSIKPHIAPQQLLIRCKNLAWNFASNAEALHCTLSLHDVAQRIKLTEDFHFDFIDEMEQNILTTMLPELLGAVAPESKARRALMPVSYRSGSIYLILRIRAVLKADTEESFEPYVTQGKLKDMQRWIDNSAKSAKHLGKFRQPLAWGAIQVFNDASRLLLHDDSQIKLYRMRPALDDASFYDLISSPEKMKLAKQLDGALSLSGFLYTPEKYHLQNVVDTNLTKYDSFDNMPPALGAPGAGRTVVTDLVKEVHEFEQPFHQVYPNAAYLNNFYIHPLSFSLHSSKIKAKSIAIRVYLMPFEGTPEKDGLVSIYGLSSNPNFLPCWTTTVDLGEKSPVYYDEIKIALPIQLSESYHLYFQAYAINHKVVNPKKKTDHEAETLIGVSWLKLFKDNRFIEPSIRTLQFQTVFDGNRASVAPVGYLGSAEQMLMDAGSDDKLTLTFSTRLVSSVFTTDPDLASFYSNVMKSGDDYFTALESLAKVSEREILARFVPILNFLFSLLCTPKLAEVLKMSERNKKMTSERTMLAIVDLVSKVSALTVVNGRQSISEELLMYIMHHFDPGQALREQSFQLIAAAWVKVLRLATTDIKAMGKSPNFSALSHVSKAAASSLQEHGWFYLHIIVRALALKITITKEIADDTNRKSHYQEKFAKTITKMLAVCHELRRASLTGFDFFNRTLARFMTDLYRFMDRGFVSQLVSIHLAELAKEAKVTTIFRFKFLQTLCDFEHYVALNQPTVHAVTGSSTGEMRIAFWRQHFLSGHYINEFHTLLLTGEEGRLTRAKSITKFRDLLWKHSVDNRFMTPEWQSRIASMYLPLAMIAFENVDTLLGSTTGLGVATASTNTPAEWKDWCYVVIWILRFCNRDTVLKSWCSSLKATQMAKVFSFLRFVHETFAKPLLLAQGSSPNNSGSDVPSPAAHAFLDELVLTIDDVLDHFLDCTEVLSDTSSKAFVELSALITALMRSPTSALVTSATVGMLRFFCGGLRKPLFRDPGSNFACSELCMELLALCQQQHPQVMASATAVFYLMLKMNWEEMGDFARMRRHSTVALSNILKGSPSATKLEELNRSLEAMAAHTDPALSKDFLDAVQALIQRHRRVLRACLRVEQISLDFIDLKLEYSYNIANEYQDCPELKVQWLMEMARLCEKGESWEEAAMCRIQSAWLAAQYLRQHPSSPNAQYHAFATPNSTLLRLAPNLLSFEPPLIQTPPISSTWLTEESIISVLFEAGQNFAKAEQYESAVDVFSMYSQFCLDVKKYQQLAQNGNLMQEWASKAEKSIRSQSRIPPNFYRVGFYGKEFADSNGKEYIYKAAPSIRLSDFTEKLVSRYAPQIVVEVLNNKPIAEQKIDPSKHYVQIVNLEPYIETDVNKEITWLDRTRNVRRFYFETAYSPDGGRPSEDVSKMYKRKELIVGKLAFPNFFMRVEVETKETMLLKPIDCALDLMVLLTSKLKTALNCVPIVAKNLQIILQGAVLAQVNAGPAAIIATFLNNPDGYPPESIEKLKESIRAFVRACNFGLILNAKLIQDQPETAALQEAMMSAFTALQAEAAKHIDI